MELPGIGEHCSQPNCNLLDFLPFTCSLCGNKYCQDHHKYDDHSCSERYKLDVQVPICPLCDKPVPSKRGLAPDLAVNEHLERNCQSKNKKTNKNRCSVPGCKIKELVSIQCDSCNKNFCLRHRHTVDHDCVGPAVVQRERPLNGSIFKNWFSGRSSSSDNPNSNSRTTTTNKNSPLNKTTPLNGISRPSRILEVSPSVREANVSTFQGNVSEDEAMNAAILKSQGRETPAVSDAPWSLSEEEDLARAIELSLQQTNPRNGRTTATNSSSDCSVS